MVSVAPAPIFGFSAPGPQHYPKYKLFYKKVIKSSILYLEIAEDLGLPCDTRDKLRALENNLRVRIIL